MYEISTSALDYARHLRVKASIEKLLPTIPKSEYEVYTTLKKYSKDFYLNIEQGHICDVMISSKELTCIPPKISQLPHLQYLSLICSNIKRIEHLENLTQLLCLDLIYNQVSKIEGLDNATQLVVLNLYNNKITKIENLDALTKLEYIQLGSNKNYRDSNKITRIEGLDKLVNLKKIGLENNPINWNSPETIKQIKKLTDRGVKVNTKDEDES